MKLESSVQAKIQKFFVTGTITKNEENHGLKTILEELKNQGFVYFKNKYTNFAEGLLANFKNEGLLADDGSLTEQAESVIKTGKSWKTLSGLFIVDLLVSKDNKSTYVLNIELTNKEKKDQYENKKLEEDNLLIFSDWKQDDYKVSKDDFLDDKIFLIEEKDIFVKINYDFDKKEFLYKIEDNSDYPFIKTSADSEFSLIANPETILQNEFEKDIYENCIKYDSVDKKMVLQDFDYSYSVIKNVFENQFKNKVENDSKNANCAVINFNSEFSISKNMPKEISTRPIVRLAKKMKLDFTLKDFKFTILKESVLNKVLSAYLLQKTAQKYCGYDEIAEFIFHFRQYFEKNPPIKNDTKSIYNELVELAKSYSKKSYLKLQAYLDLSDSETKSKYEKIAFDFANTQTSIQEITEKILGEQQNINSVTILSKYAASNIGIARAIKNMAQVINEDYGCTLKLITTTEFQNQSQKKYYQENLKKNQNLTLVEKKKSEINIHNRYVYITYSKESGIPPKWIEMPCELDSLDYGTDDFINGNPKNVRPDDKGIAKELKIYETDENHINAEIKKAFGLK